MKTFLSMIGILTLAQWLFIGLLHVFLVAQDKRSPETLNKLHDMPVVGGYFPAVPMPTPEDEQREAAEKNLLQILEAKKYFELPAAFDAEELSELIQQIRSQKDDLETQAQEIAQRREEIQQLAEDYDRREKELLARQSALEKRASSLQKTEEELALKRSIVEDSADAIETTNLKKVATWMNGLPPEKAAELIVPDSVRGEGAEARRMRYRDAAKLLSLMDAEAASKVIANIDPLDWLEIEKEKRKLPLKKK